MDNETKQGIKMLSKSAFAIEVARVFNGTIKGNYLKVSFEDLKLLGRREVKFLETIKNILEKKRSD